MEINEPVWPRTRYLVRFLLFEASLLNAVQAVNANESFLFTSLKIPSPCPRPYCWSEWKLWWLKPGVITQPKTTIYSYEWDIISVSPFSSFPASSQDSLPQVCFNPSFFSFSGFQDPHICSFTRLEALKALSLLLLLWVIVSISVPQKSFPWPTARSDSVLYFSTVLCSLLSRFCCSLYNLNFLHHFSPAPTPNPTHSRSTGSASDWHKAAYMLISSCGLAMEHPGTWQAFFNLYMARSCWCFCSVHFCFLSVMEREI